MAASGRQDGPRGDLPRGARHGDLRGLLHGGLGQPLLQGWDKERASKSAAYTGAAISLQAGWLPKGILGIDA
jgi:hypothetical protein